MARLHGFPVNAVTIPGTSTDRESYTTQRGTHVCALAASDAVDAESAAGTSVPACVHVVDDDQSIRESLGNLVRSVGYEVTLYPSATAFLDAELADLPSCLVLDVRLPGMSGLGLQAYLSEIDIRLPVILISGFADISMSVKGMKAGAIDFLTKPVCEQDLLDAIGAAIRFDSTRRWDVAQTVQYERRYGLLTPREREVAIRVASGLMNKQVAAELSIAEPTVKMHRGSAMRKLGVKSVASLAWMMEILGIRTLPSLPRHSGKAGNTAGYAGIVD